MSEGIESCIDFIQCLVFLYLENTFWGVVKLSSNRPRWYKNNKDIVYIVYIYRSAIF